jgi:hypothetical protein
MSAVDATHYSKVSWTPVRSLGFEWLRRLRGWSGGAAVVFGVYLCLILVTFQSYGITYDEDWHHIYGRDFINWYLSGFKDTSALSFSDMPLRGGAVFDALIAFAVQVSPLGEFETGHLLNALVALIGVLYVYRLAKLIGGSAAGTLAALFLVLIPRFYGHSFINPADVPLATLSALVLYYVARIVRALPEIHRDLIVKLGLVIGLSLGIRVGMILLIGYAGLAFGLWFIGQYVFGPRARQRAVDARAIFMQLARAFAGMCAIAFVVMTIAWPAAMTQPILQEIRSLRYTTNFLFSFNILFEGQLVSIAKLPWYYVPKWFLITLPEFVLLALGAGVVICVLNIARRRVRAGDLCNGNPLVLLVVVVSATLPIVYAVVTNPVDYDEVRHFLFVIPSVAVLCGVSAALVLRNARSSWLARVTVFAGAVSMLATASDMWQLHPYEYVFFNHLFAGGVTEASNEYEMDYWGSSLKEGVDWLVHDYAGPQTGARIKVASCLYSVSTSYYLPSDRFEYLGSYGGGAVASGEPDVFLASTRWGCDQRQDGPVIHVVSREGAPLLLIKQIANPPVASQSAAETAP